MSEESNAVIPLAGDQVPNPSTKTPNSIISPVSSTRTAEAEWGAVLQG